MQFICIIENLKYGSKHINVTVIVQMLALCNVLKSTELMIIYLKFDQNEDKVDFMSDCRL
jgi:uncharacterized protein YehS (DUF1456 family)